MLERLLSADVAAFLFLNWKGLDVLDPFMLFISERQVWWVLGTAVTTVIVLFAKRPLLLRWLTVLLALGLADFTNTHLLKERIKRPRPCHVLAPIRLVPDYCGGRNGFPSNHAANGTAITVTMGLLFGWKIGIPAVLVAMLVGYSRIYLGVHFPLDVLCGFLWGTLVAWLTARFAFPRLEKLASKF